MKQERRWFRLDDHTTIRWDGWTPVTIKSNEGEKPPLGLTKGCTRFHPHASELPNIDQCKNALAAVHTLISLLAHGATDPLVRRFERITGRANKCMLLVNQK